jgi:hypothetical protein
MLLLLVVVPSTAPMGIVNVRTFRILVVQGCCCYWEGGRREVRGLRRRADRRSPSLWTPLITW